MTSQREITPEQMSALAKKLDSLDLTDDEQFVLRAVFAAAAPDGEVEGYAVDSFIWFEKPGGMSEGFANVFKPGGKVGFPGGGGSSSVSITGNP